METGLILPEREQLVYLCSAFYFGKPVVNVIIIKNGMEYKRLLPTGKNSFLQFNLNIIKFNYAPVCFTSRIVNRVKQV